MTLKLAKRGGASTLAHLRSPRCHRPVPRNRWRSPQSHFKLLLVAFETRCELKLTRTSACRQGPSASFVR